MCSENLWTKLSHGKVCCCGCRGSMGTRRRTRWVQLESGRQQPARWRRSYAGGAMRLRDSSSQLGRACNKNTLATRISHSSDQRGHTDSFATYAKCKQDIFLVSWHYRLTDQVKQNALVHEIACGHWLRHGQPIHGILESETSQGCCKFDCRVHPAILMVWSRYARQWACLKQCPRVHRSLCIPECGRTRPGP